MEHKHEAANFAKEAGVLFYGSADPKPPTATHLRRRLEVTLLFRVCRLCGGLYTDMEDVAIAERQYAEATGEAQEA